RSRSGRRGRLVGGLERLDLEVVEPGVRLPVVDGEVLVAVALERPRVGPLEERRGHVVDVPGEARAGALEAPAVAAARLHLGRGAAGHLLAVLVAAGEDRLAVAPAAH